LKRITMKKKAIIVFATVVALLAGIAAVSYVRQADDQFQLIPQKRIVERSGEAEEAEVGTGWSTKEDPGEAVKEALGMALAGKKSRVPHFAIVFATSGGDTQQILLQLRELLGDKTRIYGGSSDSRGVMTDKGFVKAAETGYGYGPPQRKHALAIMTVTSEYINFGVGSANCAAYPSVQEASKAATLNAILNAGKPQSEMPRIVLVTTPSSLEEEAIEGIEQVLGTETPIIGGTAGGPVSTSFGERQAYASGISLTAIYTDLPMGWTFEAGFDVPDQHSGVVTKVEGRTIAEIDNRPSLDVYDEWLDGHIGQLAEKSTDPASIRELLTLHPLYRKYTSPSGQNYFLFSHPWPKDDSLKSRSFTTSTQIKEGERVYLCHGSWQTLLNRIGNLPRKAKLNAGIRIDTKPILGIGYICAGAMGVIPESEREKISLLINHANNGAPFIGPFTWGEQGHFPGMANAHGNLLTGFLVIGERPKK